MAFNPPRIKAASTSCGTAEARFLYLVATHSGYFALRQFLALTGAKWGSRVHQFGKNLLNRGHATWHKYPGVGGVYHPSSTRIYELIDKETLRNRREHSTDFIRVRLVLLDLTSSATTSKRRSRTLRAKRKHCSSILPQLQ